MKAEAWIFGITTVFVAVVAPGYWFLSGDWTGTSALVMTALLTAMITLYLGFHASRMDPRPEDRKEGEIADGALLIFPSAEHLEETAIQPLRAGREKAGKSMEGFDVSPTLPLAVGDDVMGLADMFRPYTALYVGGMGSRKQNFYNQLAQRMGYEKEAAEIQDKYLDGDKAGAAAAAHRCRPDHDRRLRTRRPPRCPARDAHRVRGPWGQPLPARVPSDRSGAR